MSDHCDDRSGKGVVLVASTDNGGWDIAAGPEKIKFSAFGVK